MRSQLRQWQSNNHFPWRELVGNHSCFYRQYHWLTIEIGITTMVITAIFIFHGRVNRRWDTSSAVIIASFVAAHSFTPQGQFLQLWGAKFDMIYWYMRDTCTHHFEPQNLTGSAEGVREGQNTEQCRAIWGQFSAIFWPSHTPPADPVKLLCQNFVIM